MLSCIFLLYSCHQFLHSSCFFKICFFSHPFNIGFASVHLLISLEFKKQDKVFNLISKIYNILGNKDLSKKIIDPNLRLETINSLKDELGGIYQKDKHG